MATTQTITASQYIDLCQILDEESNEKWAMAGNNSNRAIIDMNYCTAIGTRMFRRALVEHFGDPEERRQAVLDVSQMVAVLTAEHPKVLKAARAIVMDSEIANNLNEDLSLKECLDAWLHGPLKDNQRRKSR